MNSTSLQTELSNLFEQRNFQAILERAQSDEISPANNPHASNIVAAALQTDVIPITFGVRPYRHRSVAIRALSQCMEQYFAA